MKVFVLTYCILLVVMVCGNLQTFKFSERLHTVGNDIIILSFFLKCRYKIEIQLMVHELCDSCISIHAMVRLFKNWKAKDSKSLTCFF